MALDFTGDDGDVVTVTDDASFNDQASFSVLTVVKFDDFGKNRRVWQKPVSGGRKDLQHNFTTTDKLEFTVPRATAPAELVTTDQFSAGTWYWILCTYDATNGPSLYYATPTAAPVEASYDTQNTGSGTTSDDNGNDLDIGNRPATRSINGQIARFQWFNEELTLAKFKELWRNPFALPTNRKIWLELGRHGTGTQVDLSGNGNTGAVTGATLASHAPVKALSQYRYSRTSIVRAAAAAGFAHSQAIIVG